MRHGAPESRSLRSLRRNDKSALTPYILVSGPKGSKRNIGNVLADYLTNCYKLRRAFSRPAESAASYIPPSAPPRSHGGLVLAFVGRTNDTVVTTWCSHMSIATAMVLTLISTAVHSRGAARRRSDGRWNRTKSGNWKKNLDRLTEGSRQRAISSLSRSAMIPVERCLLAGAPISLSHGELAATANSYRFIDAENSSRGCGPLHSGLTK